MLAYHALAFLPIISALCRSVERVEEMSWYTTAVARNVEGCNVTNKYSEDQTTLEEYNWMRDCCKNYPCHKTCTNCEWEKESLLSLTSPSPLSKNCMKVRIVPKDFPEPMGYDSSSTECLHMFKLEDDLMTHVDIDPLFHHRRKFSMYTRSKFPRAFHLFESNGVKVCVTERMTGSSLIHHLRNVQTDEDVYDFIIAMLDILVVLQRSHIIHRDIHENNLIVIAHQNNSYSIVLFDFTWAYSPTVKGMFNPPDFLNMFHRPPDATNLVRKTAIYNAEDVYSVGSLIKSMLIMYTNVNIAKWTPFFDAMMSVCTIEDCANVASDLLMGNGVNFPTVTTSEASLSANDRERQVMCNHPNIFAGHADVEMRIIEGLNGYDKVSYVRTSGYQPYEIMKYPSHVELNPLSIKLQEKSDALKLFLREVVKDMTILDIGGNYGYFSAISVMYGAKSATVIDMDKAYTTKAAEIYNFLGPPFSDRIHVQNKKLGQMDDDSADIVIALALIHWSFNCSETTGNLARTVGHLAKRAKKVLIIEWVEPDDWKNHLSQPVSITTSRDDDVDIASASYSYKIFALTMKKIFQCDSGFYSLSQNFLGNS